MPVFRGYLPGKLTSLPRVPPASSPPVSCSVAAADMLSPGIWTLLYPGFASAPNSVSYAPGVLGHLPPKMRMHFSPWFYLCFRTWGSITGREASSRQCLLTEKANVREETGTDCLLGFSTLHGPFCRHLLPVTFSLSWEKENILFLEYYFLK